MNKAESLKYGKIAAAFMAIVANSLPFVMVDLKRNKSDYLSIGATSASTYTSLIVLISIIAIVIVLIKKNWSKMGYAICGVLNLLLMIGVGTSATDGRKEHLFVGFFFMLIGCIAQAAIGVIEVLPDILKATATSPAAAQQIANQQPTYDPSAAPVQPVAPVQPMNPIDPSAPQQ